MPEVEEPYFLDPLAGYPLAADPELEDRVRRAFAVLRTGGDLAASEVSMRDLLGEDPGFHPAQVLLAQVAFVRRGAAGDPATGSVDGLQAARDLLAPVADELPDYLACQILLGRVAELMDDPVRAFESYRRASSGSSVARDRAVELEPRASEVLVGRIGDLIDRGHLEDAGAALAGFEGWAGDGLSVLRLRRSLAYAEGDVESEIEALKRLAVEDTLDETVPERLADLHLISGDVAAALEMLEVLAAQRPDDSELAEKLARAKFLWRLQLLPSHVHEIASKSVLSRAELATMLYWLVPSVRYAEVADPPIATDILDHPRREEILPVMFLDLLPVDETLHRFSPERPVTRVQTLGALLGLLRLSGEAFACLGSEEASRLAFSQALTCRKAAECRLIPEVADCLPQAQISGPDALDIFRRGLDLLGSR